MKRSAFLFYKGLGLLFAIFCGIGTAVLGWYDGADWMNIVTFSLAVTGLILWGWYHFSIRWIDSDLKQNILSQFPKKDQVERKDLPEEEHEENFFFKTIRDNKWKTLAFILLILIFIFVSFIAEDFFSGRTLVSFLIFSRIYHINGGCWSIHNRPKKCVYWYFCLNCIVYNRSSYHTGIPFAS
jgi:hypothetical protein